MIRETKIDNFFPTEYFIVEGYSSIYRLDRNERGEGTMLLVKDSPFTSHLDKYCFLNEIEIFYMKLNLRERK